MSRMSRRRVDGWTGKARRETDGWSTVPGWNTDGKMSFYKERGVCVRERGRERGVSDLSPGITRPRLQA